MEVLLVLLEIIPLIVIEVRMIHGREIILVEEELDYRRSNMLVRFWMIST